MTTTNKPLKISGTSTNDALIDQLRACKNPDEILKFENGSIPILNQTNFIKEFVNY